MNSVISTNSVVARVTQQIWTNCYFKFVLPHIEHTTLHGIELRLTALPPKIRNRILKIGYEDAEREICRDMVTFADSVLELGGGIGFLGLYCQLKLGVKRYITVEANPRTIDILKENYRINGIDPVVWNYAVGSEIGPVSLDVSGDFWEHHVTMASISPKTITVESTTLQRLLDKAGVEVTTLVIDIEGAERYINFDMLPPAVRKIIIEVHNDILGEHGVKRLFANIRAQGFRTAHCKGATFGFLRD